MFHKQGFFGIQAAEIEHMQPFLMPLLKEFEKLTGLTTAEEILAQAKRRDAQLWSYHDGHELRGVIATTVKAGIGCQICTIWVCYANGGPELYDGVLDEIEKWAKSIGCTTMEIVGREGWARVARGYIKTAVVLEKSLLETH